MIKLIPLAMLLCAMLFVASRFLPELPSAVEIAKIQRQGDADAKRWAVGTERKEELDYEFKGALEPEKGLKTTFNGLLKGVLTTTVAGFNKEGDLNTLVKISLDKISLNIPMEKRALKKIKKDFKTPFKAIYSTRGRLVHVFKDPKKHPATHNLIWSILASGQLIIEKKDSWETKEEDPTGSYQARYLREDLHKKALIFKSKIAYLDVNSKGSMIDMIATTKGYTRYSLIKKDAIVSEYKGDDHVTLKTKDGEQAGFLKYTIFGKYISQKKTAFSSEKLQKRFKKERAKEKPLHKESAIRAPQKKAFLDMSYDDLAELIEDYARLDSQSEKRHQRSSLYLKIKAFLTQNPDKMALIKEDLMAEDCSLEKLSLFATALARTGSKEAQKVLAEVILSKKDDYHAQQILLPSLSMVKTPSMESQKTIESLSESGNENIKMVAGLSLGIMANKLKDYDQRRFEDLLAKTKDNLKQTKNPKDIGSYLSSLGNMASDKAISSIKPYLNHSNERLRRDAIMALRLNDSDESRSLLKKSLMTDKSKKMRQAAANALTYGKDKKENLRVLIAGFAEEKELSVQKHILSKIYQLKNGDSKKVEDFLRNITTSSQIPSLRQQAARLLDRNTN